MRFSEKVGKLKSGKAVKSAERHLRRMLIDWGRGIRFDPKGLIREMDTERFDAVRQRYLATNPDYAWVKYLDLEYWMENNLRRINDLQLDRGGPKRILDLGCGTGYFLFIARCLGHDVVGLDIDDSPLFTEITDILGLPRVIWSIKAYEPLPDLGAPFDLITAFMICFNGHKSAKLWAIPEWEFFLDDLESRLNPGGRICLGFNREENGELYSPELLRYLEERGAETFSGNVVLTKRATAPKTASLA